MRANPGGNWPCIDCEASVRSASRVMRELSVDKVVVMVRHDGVRIPLGTVSAEDIVTRVVAVGLDTSVLTAGDLLTLPVVDRSGKVTGVLTLDDLLEALARRHSEE